MTEGCEACAYYGEGPEDLAAHFESHASDLHALLAAKDAEIASLRKALEDVVTWEENQVENDFLPPSVFIKARRALEGGSKPKPASQAGEGP